jgi:hypothetical protein
MQSMTPLMLAVENNHDDAVDSLLELVDDDGSYLVEANAQVPVRALGSCLFLYSSFNVCRGTG